MPVSSFREWLTTGDTTIPFQNDSNFEESKHKRVADGKFGSGGSSKTEQPKDRHAAKEKKAVKPTPEDEAAHAKAKAMGIKIPPSYTKLHQCLDQSRSKRSQKSHCQE